MPKEFTMKNPGSQITRMINNLGNSVPIEMIVREAAVNGHDANKRLFPNKRGTVIFARDHENSNKLSIINYDGDFFDQKNIDALTTIADTNNTNPSNTSENYGIGAKVAYLPYGNILYRSKKAGEDLGIQFVIEKDPKSGNYGLKDFWCDYEEVKTNTPVCDTFSKYLTKDRAGTEMVLLGTSDDQDTFLQIEKECGITGKTKATGWNIYNYFHSRLFKDIGTDFKVEVYRAGTNEVVSHYKIPPLLEKLQKSENYGTVTLVGEQGVPDGTIAHYGLVDKSSSGQGLTSGFISYAFKNENYLNLKCNPRARSIKLMNSGIHTKSTSWFIVFEIPSNSVQVSIPATRTALDGIEEENYQTAFSDNLPKVISDWLDSQRDYEEEDKDISKWLKNRHKCKIEQPVCGPEDGDKNCNDREASTLTAKQRSKKARISNYQKTKKEKSALKKLQQNEPPEIMRVENGPEVPLVQFLNQGNSHKILINTDSLEWKYRCKQISNDFKPGIKSAIELELTKRHADSAWGRITEIMNVYKEESIQKRKDRWNPEILSGIWTYDQQSEIKRVLKTKYKTHKKK